MYHSHMDPWGFMASIKLNMVCFLYPSLQVEESLSLEWAIEIGAVFKLQDQHTGSHAEHSTSQASKQPQVSPVHILSGPKVSIICILGACGYTTRQEFRVPNDLVAGTFREA